MTPAGLGHEAVSRAKPEEYGWYRATDPLISLGSTG